MDTKGHPLYVCFLEPAAAQRARLLTIFFLFVISLNSAKIKGKKCCICNRFSNLSPGQWSDVRGVKLCLQRLIDSPQVK